ncbi:MAG: response regulator [Christensenellaceae bacterium]
MGVSGKKILVADDIDLDRIILNDMFMDEYDVLEAENGFLAWKLIDKYREELAVVLLDVVMPVMTGFDVLRNMAESGLIDSIPVILVTGESDEGKAIYGYDMGISDLIEKPFNQAIVYRRVQNVIKLYAHKRELEKQLKEQKMMLENK